MDQHFADLKKGGIFTGNQAVALVRIETARVSRLTNSKQRGALMKRLAMGLAVILLSAGLHAQERRAYEGVVGLEGKTIGTLILLDSSGTSLQGWIRLEDFLPIDGGSVLEYGVEFTAAGNRYEVDERRGRISYSGQDGEGSRYIRRLESQTGRLEELTESRRFSRIAMVEVNGRVRRFAVGRPTLWKHSEAPFETFDRIEDLLGKEISLWLADTDNRGGRLVAIEEPADMNIPLKEP